MLYNVIAAEDHVNSQQQQQIQCHYGIYNDETESQYRFLFSTYLHTYNIIMKYEILC